MNRNLEILLRGVPVFPLMGRTLNADNTLPLDFSPANKELQSVNLSNTAEFDTYVFGLLKASGKSYGIGGYFEHRAIYSRSEVFATEKEDFRDIHLGVDVWAEAGHPVSAPMAGKVHSFQDNEGFGNYGPTIILEHELHGHKLYSLYGHLSRSDLQGLEVGKEIAAGEEFCHLGPYPENGDWPAHVHFQLMWDMQGNVGDFPGVCSHRDIEKFKALCPDPNLLIYRGG